MKKVVNYFKLLGPVHVRHHAYVGTVNHPGPFVTNNGDGWVRTSPVVQIVDQSNPDRPVFETENSRYQPHDEFF